MYFKIRETHSFVRSGIVVFSLSLGSQFASAAEPSFDRSAYHLFKPVPFDQMRELSTDRPDKTESPYTVDAGHFQVELDAVNYTYDRSTQSGVLTSNGASVFVPNLKWGLTTNSDIQLIVESFRWSQTDQDGQKSQSTSFGNTTLRYKYNFLGNDSGPVALAIMPYLEFPTSGQDPKDVQGGLIFPVAIALPFDIGMGMMFQWDLVRNEQSAGYHPNWVSSITFSRDLLGDLGGYVELFSEASAEAGSAWVSTFDFGFTYGLNPNTQLDLGMNIGLTEAADDLNPFVGITWRH